MLKYNKGVNLTRKIKHHFVFYLSVLSFVISALLVYGFNSFSAGTVTHTFRINPSGQGTVVGGGHSCSTTCTFTYSVGSTPVSYTAIPAANYQFVGWENIRSVREGYDYTNNPLSIIRTTSWNFRVDFAYVPPPPPPPPPVPTNPTPPVPTTPTTPTTTTPTPTPTTSTPKTSTTSGSTTTQKKTATTQITKTGDIVAPVEDKEPPTVPTALVSEYIESTGAIYLSWAASTDNGQVAGYEIERADEGVENWQNIGDTESGNFTDFNFEYNKSYQYRVRAYDQVKNYSAYSEITTASAGQFIPNVTVQNGGEVTDSEGVVYFSFGQGAVSEDIFLSIEKIEDSDFPIESGTKIVGEAFDVRAKNSRGEEVHKFNKQINIKFKYTKKDISGFNPQTIKIATLKDDKVEYLRTKTDTKARETRTLTDHLSIYMIVGEKGNSILTFLRILLWILVIIGIAYAGYFGWLYQQKKRYQKEHREDYIYKH